MSKSITLIADQVHEKMKDRPAWVHVLHTNSPDMAQALAELVTHTHAQSGEDHNRADRAGVGRAYRAGLRRRGVRAAGCVG